MTRTSPSETAQAETAQAETAQAETAQAETAQARSDGDQQEFYRLEQLNLTMVVLGFLLLATPMLFILASIGTGAPVVRLGLVISVVWLALITASFVFARQVKRRGYLGR